MTTFELIGQIALAVAIVSVGAVLGGNLFDVIVNEKNLTRNFPDSVEHIRRFYKFSNPGHFFRLFTPIYGLSALIALLCFWHVAYGRRWLIIGSILSYALTQVITIVYFFPQNQLLREGPIDELTTLFTKFATTRTYLDFLRNVLTLTAVVLLLIALSQPLR